ncbi:hypothetical protein O181_132836 [Austropuccinia psidii MF-1]|uniref:Uncharacterized protein n=1 Tax=Austropuccinia psidii MF-1 TaxID=1389203 RepID=A0A9Q3QBI4_9BASI|nr:hypothetical protein [Austropuccinia psidii MF-1]
MRSGKYAKAFGRGHELLLTHQELSGSGEDHRTLRRLKPLVLQRQGRKDKELVEEPKSFTHSQKKELEMTPALEKEGPVGSISSRTVQRKAQRTLEETERSQEKSWQGKRQRPYPQGYKITKLEHSAMKSMFNMVRTLMKFTVKE